MKKIILIIALLIAVSSSSINAQSRSSISGIINFAWDMNLPLNNKDFISKFSLPGARLESRWFVNPNMSFGVEIEWFSMYEYAPTQTYHLENLDITTDLYKYLYSVPLTASLHYYPVTDGKAIPYVGLAAGAAYVEPSVYFNIYQITDDNWGFTFKPEIGCIVPFGDGANYGLSLSARYNYSTNKFENLNFKNMQTISFQVGLALLR